MPAETHDPPELSWLMVRMSYLMVVRSEESLSLRTLELPRCSSIRHHDGVINRARAPLTGLKRGLRHLPLDLLGDGNDVAHLARLRLIHRLGDLLRIVRCSGRQVTT